MDKIISKYLYFMYNSKVIPDYCNQRLQSPLDFELFFSNPPQISSPNTYIHVQFKSDTISEKLLISQIKRTNDYNLHWISNRSFPILPKFPPQILIFMYNSKVYDT